MEIRVRDADSDEDFRFVAERFEETISLWEDYAVSEDSVSKQQARVASWASEENVHLTVAQLDGERVGFNSLYTTKGYSGEELGASASLDGSPASSSLAASASLADSAFT